MSNFKTYTYTLVKTSRMSSINLRTSFPACCRKIVCIGRNYLDHVNELNNVVPAEPMMFLKPTTSILKEGEGPVIKPKMCTNLHHEVSESEVRSPPPSSLVVGTFRFVSIRAIVYKLFKDIKYKY